MSKHSISICEHESPPFSKVAFECDEPINAKIDRYELTKRYMNRTNTTCFVGKQGSGKTSLLINLIKHVFKKCYHNIYVFMPETSRASLKHNIFECLKPEQLYDELNHETIADVYEKLQVSTAKKEYSLVIYDDVQKSLKDASVLLSLKNMIANMRHLRCTNFIILQNYMALDLRIRELVTNVILFKLSKKQNEKIFEELIESHKNYFDEIRDRVFDKPNQWLFINIQSQTMFKMFDEIKIDGEDDDGVEI